MLLYLLAVGINPPNVEAVHRILEIAKNLPEVCFLVVGSVGLAFSQSDRIPKNVSLMGIVDDETKDIVLGVARSSVKSYDFWFGH